MRSNPLVYILPLLMVAGLVGVVVGRNIFQGGWGRRWTHRTCGWFEVHGFQLPGNGEPCPRCGETDAKWYWRIGRPISFLPFGWQWQADEPVNNRLLEHTRPESDSVLDS